MTSLRTMRARLAGPAAPWRRASFWFDIHGPAGMGLAAALALGYAWWLFGFPMLHGTAPFWWRDNADVTQYLAGFNAFASDQWRWPLLRVDTLNTPDGTLATFLDAIPLYSLVLKVLTHGKGYWNPFGLWIALCFILQGVGAWWICREARMRNWAALAALALLFAAFPALTFRISHTSLMSQWLLLFAFAVYLRSVRLERLATGWWMALVVGAFYINIYLCAMVSSIFAADVLRQLLHRPAGPDAPAPALRSTLLAPVAVFGLLFLTMWATMLPLPPGAGNREWGFGYFSMNLLAPLHGGIYLQLEHPLAHDGQNEGYNYVGVFVLALAVAAWRLTGRRDPGFWRRHRVLTWVLALLAMFAVSNIVHLGSARLFAVLFPEWMQVVTTSFRASGRFFWPVGYAITAFAVLGFARHVHWLVSAPVLAGLLALQYTDLEVHHHRVHVTVAHVKPAAVDAARWDAFLGPGITAMHYYPPFRCTDAPASNALLPVMAYAVKHRYPFSTGYIARAAKRCDDTAQTIAQLPDSTAVAFEKASFPQLADARKLMGPDSTCADMDIVFLCRSTIHQQDRQ
ncbi:DUF6311 domain-containing protein [Massilia agri]|uniref:DUF6311 domain-containing protein n=1 Tax=Massilia agri TaxID=1886785 RepID=A0ABT2ANH6_9BURK|nr:DUF6311 domain-containing protein [Massilia agri]MCS0597303.1 DUF6311 domain-containing protein [Massilia agri]